LASTSWAPQFLLPGKPVVYSGDIEKDGENPWFPSEKIYTWWVKTTLICYFTEGYTFW